VRATVGIMSHELCIVSWTVAVHSGG
jgi:hypothetical protein